MLVSCVVRVLPPRGMDSGEVMEDWCNGFLFRSFTSSALCCCLSVVLCGDDAMDNDVEVAAAVMPILQET